MSAPVVRFHPASELRDMVAPTVDWIIEDLVAPGVITSLDGWLRLGKTSFMTAAVGAILHGCAFLERTTRKTGAVYLTEQTPVTFREPLAQAELLEENDLLIVFRHEVAGIPWRTVMSQVTTECLRRNAGLVIDTLHQFAGLKGDASNDEGSALEVMGPVQDAAAKGIWVLVGRHERKAGGEPGEAARGSSATAGAIDIILSFRRPKGEPTGSRREIVSLSRFASTPEKLLIDLGPHGYRVIETGGADGDLQAVAARVLRVLGDRVMTEPEIRTKEGSTLVPRAIREVLLKENLIAVSGKGVKGDPFRYQRLSRSFSFPNDIERESEMVVRNEQPESRSGSPLPKGRERGRAGDGSSPNGRTLRQAPFEVVR